MSVITVETGRGSLLTVTWTLEVPNPTDKCMYVYTYIYEKLLEREEYTKSLHLQRAKSEMKGCNIAVVLKRCRHSYGGDLKMRSSFEEAAV